MPPKFVSVIFIAVDARTEYEAIAKRTAACRQLVTTDRRVDGYELVFEITKPAPQLLERWVSLPDATRTSSETGQQRLERLRDVIDSDTPGWATVPSEFQVLYDEWGTAISERNQIATLEANESLPVYHEPVHARASETERDEHESDNLMIRQVPTVRSRVFRKEQPRTALERMRPTHKNLNSLLQNLKLRMSTPARD